jgi:asparagine synthase (glutamine-hydrolysing)
VKTTIAVLNKKGDNTIASVIGALKKVTTEKEAYFTITTPSMQVTEKNLEKINKLYLNSPVAIGHFSLEASLPEDIQYVKQKDATLFLEGTVYSSTEKISELLKPQVNRVQMASNFIRNAEGDFALLAIKEKMMIAARDPIGVQPLYYGENQDFAAVASNRKALWALGVKEVWSFPPGHVATATSEGVKFEPAKTLAYTNPISMDIDEAARILKNLLDYSVQIRVFGLKKVAVAFSGGVDSSIVAYLAKKYCPNVNLIHVSLENQFETQEALEAAKELGLPLYVHLFKETDVELTIPKVLELIEEADPLKVNVGIPFYWAAQKTAEAKLQVLLAGQGADELFGGYQRYVKQYLISGDEKVRQTMFNDVAKVYESNLERDMKICISNNVKLRLPFASYNIAEYAMSLPTELKFEKDPDSLRKLVLRKVASNLGIPACIAQKPKKAVQYSTGISSVLKKLAKKQNITLGCYLNDLFVKQTQKNR